MTHSSRAVIVACLILGSCAQRPDIIIGTKNFSEQVILGEILAQHIERRTGLKVDLRSHLGGTFICHRALVAGDIDLYPEYTGTAWTAILKHEPGPDRQMIYRQVQREYQALGLEWLAPLGFNNTFAMLIRGEEARLRGVKSLSQAAAYAPHWRAGFGYEFAERKDGLAGLAAIYGLRFKEPARVMDLGLLYKALADREVDFTAGNSTDGLIKALDLYSLIDDKNYFPPYDAGIVVRQEILQRHPSLRAILLELGGAITEQDMRQMNYLVDSQRQPPALVAAGFLAKK